MLLQVFMGGVMVLSYAPFNLWWLQLLLLPLALHLWRREPSTKQALCLSAAFGGGYFFVGMQWVTHSMTLYGGVPWWLAEILWMLASVILAFPFLLLAWAFRRWQNSVWLIAWGWALMEWVRGRFLFSGLPWLSLGYAHTDAPLAAYAPFIGVYGLGMLVVALSLLLLALLQRRQKVCSGLTIVGIFLLAGGLQFWRFTTPLPNPVTVSLLQPNIPQENKFSSNYFRANLEHYRNLIAASQGVLVVTPESILPLIMPPWPQNWWAQVGPSLQARDAKLAMGVLSRNQEGVGNSVWLANARGEVEGVYHKYHLVPFGEYVPPGFQWLVDKMQIPLSNLLQGRVDDKSIVLDSSGQKVTLLFNICYEDAFGEEFAARLRHADAQVFVNVSNLAWFGDGIALPQHLQIARMRSYEFQKPMLSATNTGMTAHIDSYGGVVSALPSSQVGILETSVTGAVGLTPFAHIGYIWLVWGYPLLWIGALLRRRFL